MNISNLSWFLRSRMALLRLQPSSLSYVSVLTRWHVGSFSRVCEYSSLIQNSQERIIGHFSLPSARIEKWFVCLFCGPNTARHWICFFTFIFKILNIIILFKPFLRRFAEDILNGVIGPFSDEVPAFAFQQLQQVNSIMQRAYAARSANPYW